MPMNGSVLAAKLVLAYTQTIKTTEYNPETGEKTTGTRTIAPSRRTMEILAGNIVDHITTLGTVLPGIPIVSPAGPGSTSGFGKIT